MTRTLLIVTGASRGFGRAICRAFFKDEQEGKKLIRACLVARSLEGLQATKASLLSMRESTNVSIHAIDLGDLATLETQLQTMLDTLTPTEFDRLILVNNAGSLGEIGPLATFSASLQDWQRTFDLNITSPLWTTRVFGQWALQHNIPSAVMVNVSSLLAVQPFPTMALYAAGKAARDMYYQCVAKEFGDDKRVRLLNYAPGPLETAMVEEIRAAPALHESLQPNFAKKALDPMESAVKLVALLKRDDFESGAHVDFYDLPASEI